MIMSVTVSFSLVPPGILIPGVFNGFYLNDNKALSRATFFVLASICYINYLVNLDLSAS